MYVCTYSPDDRRRGKETGEDVDSFTRLSETEREKKRERERGKKRVDRQRENEDRPSRATPIKSRPPIDFYKNKLLHF